MRPWLYHKVIINEKYQSAPSSRQPGCYPCYKCGRTFKWKWNLKVHLQNSCGVQPTICCPFCSHKTKWKKSLFLHIKNKHPEQPWDP